MHLDAIEPLKAAVCSVPILGLNSQQELGLTLDETEASFEWVGVRLWALEPPN